MKQLRIVLGMIVLLAVLLAQPLHAAGNRRVLPPNARFHGSTYGEWSAAWWQWAYGLPVTDENGNLTHPLFVSGDVDCSFGQSGNVWFLGGTFVLAPDPAGGVVGIATRNCTIPSGTALFFPILNAVFDPVLPNGTLDPDITVEEMRELAAASLAEATGLRAVIDGRTVVGIMQYRAASPVFSYCLPETNNLYQYFGVPISGCIEPAVADGYYLLLPPLSVGTHTIQFEGGVPGFALDITYNITVEPRGQFKK